MRKPPALFVAGSRQQAAYWAQQLGFGRHEWQYIDVNTSRGRRVEAIYLVGTFEQRPDWPDLYMALLPTGAELILAEDMVPSGG
jgi:hypothetical protein